MSAEQNIETARQMYQAFGSGDVQAILDLVTDDVDWSTDAAIASAPWYGPRHGTDGVASFLEAIGKTGPVTEFTPLAFSSRDQVIFADQAAGASLPSDVVLLKIDRFG
jgi:ketosteroid isomerase-like protein